MGSASRHGWPRCASGTGWSASWARCTGHSGSTSDEAWSHRVGGTEFGDGSVHLADWPTPARAVRDDALAETFEHLLNDRRIGRRGFPLDIEREIAALSLYARTLP